MRGDRATGIGGLDRVARPECRDERRGGLALGLNLRRGVVGVEPLGGENGGEGLVDRGPIEGVVRGGGGLGGHGGGARSGCRVSAGLYPGLRNIVNGLRNLSMIGTVAAFAARRRSRHRGRIDGRVKPMACPAFGEAGCRVVPGYRPGAAIS
jgi:hypothetical protein